MSKVFRVHLRLFIKHCNLTTTNERLDLQNFCNRKLFCGGLRMYDCNLRGRFLGAAVIRHPPVIPPGRLSRHGSSLGLPLSGLSAAQMFELVSSPILARNKFHMQEIVSLTMCFSKDHSLELSGNAQESHFNPIYSGLVSIAQPGHGRQVCVIASLSRSTLGALKVTKLPSSSRKRRQPNPEVLQYAGAP